MGAETTPPVTASGWSRNSWASAASATSASWRRWAPSRAIASSATTGDRRAYDEAALPIEAGQSISQPYMVARMTELLAPQPGDRVLELGTGSGYQAAILAELGAHVTSLERHAELADDRPRSTRRARLRRSRRRSASADGSLGDPTARPYDGIIVTAAAPSIPVELRDQLADGGRLVIPVGPRDLQMLTLVVRHGNDWRETPHGQCVFVPLIGPGGFPD